MVNCVVLSPEGGKCHRPTIPTYHSPRVAFPDVRPSLIAGEKNLHAELQYPPGPACHRVILKDSSSPAGLGLGPTAGPQRETASLPYAFPRTTPPPDVLMRAAGRTMR